LERVELAHILGAARPANTGAAQIIEEPNPERFMAAFATALSTGGNIFLANPLWRPKERSRGRSGLAHDSKRWIRRLRQVCAA